MPLKRRLLDIAYKHKLGHLGSYLSSLDIIDGILTKRKDRDIFILSAGHAALALYVCNEKHFGVDAEAMLVKHGGHPHHDEANHIYCSTGSLGMGINIALGRAVADKTRDVHVLISDGECAEGSVWEALKTIEEQKIDNVIVHVNINGFAAYCEVDTEYLEHRLKAFHPRIQIHKTIVDHIPCLMGLNAHYHIMSERDYKQAIEDET